MKAILVIVLLFGGFASMLYPFQIVRFFGHMGWAEQRLGPGGSYTAWRLIGLAMIIASFLAVRYF